MSGFDKGIFSRTNESRKILPNKENVPRNYTFSKNHASKNHSIIFTKDINLIFVHDSGFQVNVVTPEPK